MNRFNKILVVIDTIDDAQAALTRAKALARLHAAPLDVLMPVYEPSLDLSALFSAEKREQMRSRYLAERQEAVDRLAEALRAEGFSSEARVVWDSHLFMPVIRSVVKQGYDLVVKAAKAHSRLASFFYTPTDWHLLRKCPCPVLMVKGAELPSGCKILAAVEPVAIDEDHQELNQAILSTGRQLAESLGAQLHIINAFSVIPVGTAFDGTGIYHEDYVESVRELHQQKLHDLVRPFDLPAERVHLRQGAPADVIQDFVTEADVRLVILGTLARSGVAGIFIGNTAESVLDELSCDVLTVKQPGYVTPVDVG